MHAYTGCDAVSAFAGKGKVKALKLLTSNKEHQNTFLKLGQEWDLSADLMDKLEAFTCLLYAPKASTTKVNDLRYNLFCAKKGEIESHQLPPCKDCLANHIFRANYQAGIWRRCLEQNPLLEEVGRSRRMELMNIDNTLDGCTVKNEVLHYTSFGVPTTLSVLHPMGCIDTPPN